MHVIINNLLCSPFERMSSCQPFIDSDAEGILIRSTTSCTEKSFGSDISKSTLHNAIIGHLMVLRVETRNRDPKVAQHYIIDPHYQHILRFQVTMHNSLVVSILQTISYLI